MGSGVSRIEPQGLAISGYCLIELSLRLERVPQVVQRIGAPGFEPKRLLVSGDGLIQVPADFEDATEVEVRVNPLRSQTNRLQVGSNRLTKPACVFENVPKVGMGFRTIAIDGNCASNDLHCQIEATRSTGERAKKPEGVIMVWLLA